jgi:hypothetical protein
MVEKLGEFSGVKRERKEGREKDELCCCSMGESMSKQETK